jgi:hypothetical protein
MIVKRFWGILTVVAASMCLAFPATAGSIDNVAIFTASPGGLWQTGVWAAIGISDPGALDNPFFNNLSTGALISPIPSGTYLAFLGYESVWPATPALASAEGMTAELILHYTDNTTSSATFQVGDIYAAGDWTRLSGDPLLTLGGGGFAVTPDRVGTSGGSNIVPTDGVPDVVLQFSDTGSGEVPEPGTLFSASAALAALGLLRRKFRT